MEKLYIPIVTNGKERWHMDISDLSLSQLIQLREELRIYNDSVSVIDGIIKECHLEKVGYKAPYDGRARGYKKVRKREKMEKRRKCKERKDRYD